MILNQRHPSRRTSILLVRNRQCLFPYWRQHTRLAGEHLLPQGHKGSKGRPPPKRTSNIRIQSKPIGNALGRCQRERERTWWRGSGPRKGGEKGARAPDEPHLLYTPLPVPPSFLPSVRVPNESEGSTREWIGARPIGDRFRSSLAKVEWTRAAKME